MSNSKECPQMTRLHGCPSRVLIDGHSLLSIKRVEPEFLGPKVSLVVHMNKNGVPGHELSIWPIFE